MSSVDWSKARWKEIPALQNLLQLSDLSSGDIPKDLAAAESAPSGRLLSGTALEGLSELGRQTLPAEHLSLRDSHYVNEVLEACPALLHLSDASIAGDEHMKAIRARIALRYSDDPWVQYKQLVEEKFSQRHDAVKVEPLCTSGSPNKGFYDSDIVAYRTLTARDEVSASVHATGGETAQERYLLMQAPFETIDEYEEYRDQLTSISGRALAVEQRMARSGMH